MCMQNFIKMFAQFKSKDQIHFFFNFDLGKASTKLYEK